jgi:hypothetical protein
MPRGKRRNPDHDPDGHIVPPLRRGSAKTPVLKASPVHSAETVDDNASVTPSQDQSLVPDRTIRTATQQASRMPSGAEAAMAMRSAASGGEQTNGGEHGGADRLERNDFAELFDLVGIMSSSRLITDEDEDAIMDRIVRGDEDVVKSYAQYKQDQNMYGLHEDIRTYNHTRTQYHNHTITQSHNHTITQSHNHAITQSHNHTITQSHNHT